MRLGRPDARGSRSDPRPVTCLERNRGNMRIGVMIGPQPADSARKVTRILADIDWAETAGLDSAWIPQIPNDFDALLAVALMGSCTNRIELGTAVVPLQRHDPLAVAT